MNQFIAKILKDGINISIPEQVNEYIANLDAKNSTKRMYVYSMKRYYINQHQEHNALKLINYKQDVNLENRALTSDEINHVKKHLTFKNKSMDLIFRILLDTGMRLGEFEMIDWSRQNSTSIIIETLKNNDEFRYVFISDETLSMLINYQSNDPNWKLWNRNYIQKSFNRINKQLNIPISAHALRRTKGTMMKLNGVSLDDIATSLGHKSLDNTRQYYVKTNQQYQHSVSKLGWMDPVDSLDVNELIEQNINLKKRILMLEEKIKELNNGK